MKEFIVGSDIYTVDALYHRPELAAIHLVRSEDEVALIDTGTQFSVSQIEAALEELGLGYEAIKYIILTHIHLDHAGGASSLMRRCDNATLVVHPRGAKHMADPTKLLAGAIAVYGEAEFQRLYGEITSISEERMISPNDGETLSMGKRVFEFLDTPGHASHHYCIVDQHTNGIFTGDTLGVAYQTLRDPDHAFVMPTTTPVQFNPSALHESIDRVMAKQPDCLYYTHYSALKPNLKNIAGLHEQIDDFVALTAQSADAGGDLAEEIAKRLAEYIVRRAQNELTTVAEETIKKWVSLDTNLNAQGLAFWWQHRRTV